LKQLDKVAGRIDKEHLSSTGSSDDIVSRLQSGRPESLNFSGHIIHNQLDPVPAPSSWTLANSHRSAR